jgi:osmoprotectant transport system substrate-binding protein
MRKIIALTALLIAISLPAAACVGKTLLVGTDSTPRSRVIAQVLAILINERTGTTIEVVDFNDAKALHDELTSGDVDLALAYTARALELEGLPLITDSQEALELVKTHYREELNLKWLSPLGFSEPGNTASLAATLAQKHALKKFPALPRLIAKTQSVFTEEVIEQLVGAENHAKAVRAFLRNKKLI